MSDVIVLGCQGIKLSGASPIISPIVALPNHTKPQVIIQIRADPLIKCLCGGVVTEDGVFPSRSSSLENARI
jgi:hypothetical protein